MSVKLAMKIVTTLPSAPTHWVLSTALAGVDLKAMVSSVQV